MKDPDLIVNPTTGEYYQSAFPVSVNTNVLNEFNALTSAIVEFESQNQTITIEPGEGVPGTGYDIPGNVQNQTAINNYIEGNHALANGIHELTQGFLSMVDVAGFNFSKVLRIKVIFPDGSTGIFRRTVSGLGESKWEPIESTFYDSDGNRIYFNASSYGGGWGNVTFDNIFRFRLHLNRLGYTVTTSGDGMNCDWSCQGNHCTLTCRN